jgi:head-tail adaptor
MPSVFSTIPDCGVSKMKAGKYWERVKVYARTTAEDAATGFKRPTWTLQGTYWCYTKDAKTDRKLAYGIQNSIIETEIHIRGYPDIDAKYRLEVLTTGFYYDLKGFNLDYEMGETVAMARRIPTLENGQ